jgi:hypothetical protein
MTYVRPSLAIALSVLTLSCMPLAPSASAGDDSTAGSENLKATCGGDFGVSASAKKLELFLSSSAEFMASAGALEATLLDACQDMGEELGVSKEEMEAKPGEAAVQVSCAAASAKLRGELQDLRADAKIKVRVEAKPPRCEVSMDAYAKCAGECDATVEPGKLELECKGGEIVGQCSGKCQGECNVDGKWVNASGHADGQCNGECKGSCSVAFEAPRCTGEVQPPKVDAECKASCDAKLDAQAKCEPGEAKVDISGAASSNIGERAAHVKAALESGWGAIATARAKLERLNASAQAMVRAGGQLPKAVGDLGVGAAACATQAAAGIVNASASIHVSFEASASISGAASGSAG